MAFCPYYNLECPHSSECEEWDTVSEICSIKRHTTLLEQVLQEILFIDIGGSASYSYTELDGSVNTTPLAQGGGDGGWVDWDLSGTLPEGTVVADIHIRKLGAADVVGLRRDGSALARQITALKLQVLPFLVKVEATRIVEIMSGDASDADVFSLMGYWS